MDLLAFYLQRHPWRAEVLDKLQKANMSISNRQALLDALRVVEDCNGSPNGPMLAILDSLALGDVTCWAPPDDWTDTAFPYMSIQTFYQTRHPWRDEIADELRSAARETGTIPAVLPAMRTVETRHGAPNGVMLAILTSLPPCRVVCDVGTARGK
jgi:hypothetical protein